LPPPTETAAPPTAAPTATPAGDSQPPTVSISSPADGSTVQRKQVVEIRAAASDNVSVQRVDFQVLSGSSSWTCSDTQAPYSCSWDVNPAPGVTYTIRAAAYDSAGNTASHEIEVESVK
jgi:hypothetical protein